MSDSPASRRFAVASGPGLLAVIVLAASALAAAQSPKPAPAAPQSPAPAATVRSITRAALPHGDRITIEFTRDVTYVSDRVPDPDRVYFDFSKAVVTSVASDRAAAISGTLVKKFRVGQHTDSSLRMVVELTGNPRYSVFTLYAPFRLVIDVEQPAPVDPPPTIQKASAPASLEAAVKPVVTSTPALSVPPPAVPPAVAPPPAADDTPGPSLPQPKVSTDVSSVLRAGRPVSMAIPPAASTSRGNYSLGRQLGLGVSRIVIDPGHGGHDPGAQANGIDESDLVLDVALRVEALLKDRGMDVVLTRRTDEFIPLEERTAIANREGADLFLSIHANATPDPLVKGIETYFLNFSGTPQAEAVAARENATSAKTMGNLPDLVKAITLNNKVAESRELAGMVQNSMTRELTVKNKTLKDLGVKQAPFVVLIGAQMPSVLAEISFVTNKSDAVLLKQSGYRQGIAQALVDGVTKYQGSLKKAAANATPAKGGS